MPQRRWERESPPAARQPHASPRHCRAAIACRTKKTSVQDFSQRHARQQPCVGFKVAGRGEISLGCGRSRDAAGRIGDRETERLSRQGCDRRAPERQKPGGCRKNAMPDARSRRLFPRAAGMTARRASAVPSSNPRNCSRSPAALAPAFDFHATFRGPIHPAKLGLIRPPSSSYRKSKAPIACAEFHPGNIHAVNTRPIAAAAAMAAGIDTDEFKS